MDGENLNNPPQPDDGTGSSPPPEQNNENDFAIPDEYKEKGWAKFFDGKSGEELKKEVFRSYDSSQTLIGKKVEDYIKDTDLKNLENYEEIKAALIKQIAPDAEIPQSAEEYEFNEILKQDDGTLKFEYPEDALGFFGNTFKELGITKEQGQNLLKTYTQFELEQFAKYTNPDELEKDLSEMFGEKGVKSEARKNVESLLKEFLPQQDQEFLQKTASNYTIEMFYRVAKGLVDKYEFKEGTKNNAPPAKNILSAADKDAEYNRLFKKLEELDSKPNQKPGERDAIVNEMKRIYQ